MIELIEETIRGAIPNARIKIVDPYNDGQHFEAFVVSADFEGMPLVRQHQLVLNSLRDQLESNVVHAVALKTFTPEKWETAKSDFAFELGE